MIEIQLAKDAASANWIRPPECGGGINQGDGVLKEGAHQRCRQPHRRSCFQIPHRRFSMKTAPSIFILTGAGVSAESGIATFRGAGGLWEGHRVEEVASPEGFAANPALVQRFYNERRRGINNRHPNDAHRALARLQREYQGRVMLITQNIDDLHERGGSPEVLHMHGEIFKARCVRCEMVTDWREDLDDTTLCRSCRGGLRPHIVWFGEIPLGLDEIYEALEQADLFAAIGTSGNVYPAAGFVDYARRNRRRCLEFNLEQTSASALFHENRLGPAGQTVTQWVSELLGPVDPAQPRPV